MKHEKVLTFFVVFVVSFAVSALVVDRVMAQSEQYRAGDRLGNRCFNGKYWKNCGEPDAPPPVYTQWRFVECMTNQCIANALNGLSHERSAEAKLTTWKNYTYVWYR